MSSFASIDGVETIAGELMVPLPWAWTMELIAPAEGSWKVGQSVTIGVLGRERKGTVRVGSDWSDGRAKLRVAGGAGNLGKVLEAADYAGRGLDAVVADLLRSSGEAVGDLSALRSVNLPHWSRAKTQAGFSLRRLMRCAPEGVVLRMGDDGAWYAVKPTWKSVGDNWDSLRKESYPQEDALEVHVDEDHRPEPGESIHVLDQDFLIDRAKYIWAESRFRAVLWRHDPTTQFDRLTQPIRSVVRGLEAEDREIDFRTLYLGRVAKDSSSADPVDVIVEDELKRLTVVTKTRMLTTPGMQLTVAAGTRVLVGWIGGDERHPFALAHSWHSGGSLKSGRVNFDQSFSLVGNSIGLGDTPNNCDPVVTKQDLLALYDALATSPAAGPTAAYQTGIITKLTAAGWGPPPGAQLPPGLASSTTGAKR